MRTPGALVKSVLPKGLLGRSLLILITPLILLQIVSAYVFFGTHWDLVTRRLAQTLAEDIASIVDMMETFPGDENRTRIFRIAHDSMALDMTLIPSAKLEHTGMVGAAPHYQNYVFGYSL